MQPSLLNIALLDKDTAPAYNRRLSPQWQLAVHRNSRMSHKRTLEENGAYHESPK